MRRARFVGAALLAIVLGSIVAFERAPSFDPLAETSPDSPPPAMPVGCAWACSLGTCSAGKATAPTEATSSPAAAAGTPVAATGTPPPDSAPGLRGRVTRKPRLEDAVPAPEEAAAAEPPAAKPVEVTGVVLDEGGRPIAGARVSWRASWG